MLPPSRSTSSSSKPMEQSPIPSPIYDGGSYEHFDTSGRGSSKTKIRLRFSLLGHVVGKNSTKFMSRIGSLVREHIPPYNLNWLAVSLKSKDTVWEMICMEVDLTISRSDFFLVGHTRSDGTFPMIFVEEKVKYKVIKKVKDRHKKKEREAKKKGFNQKPKVEKDLGIPNDWPFKEEGLKVLKVYRARAIKELEQKKAVCKEKAKKRKLGLLDSDDLAGISSPKDEKLRERSTEEESPRADKN
ncbi:hypothetical protein GIB67_007786 [Kingdonia uniflora]|uniref:Guanine nucleotide-binding protein-like 3 N-terminal domain-containing protein n=1 Tax=Kingdonia uniflora TaxID=39325 RepID=A0A7J7N1V8_9MAGN|nr:hypothetical protein GIB67_007786 [Kingdonia uniflora]